MTLETARKKGPPVPIVANSIARGSAPPAPRSKPTKNAFRPSVLISSSIPLSSETTRLHLNAIAKSDKTPLQHLLMQLLLKSVSVLARMERSNHNPTLISTCKFSPEVALHHSSILQYNCGKVNRTATRPFFDSLNKSHILAIQEPAFNQYTQSTYCPPAYALTYQADPSTRVCFMIHKRIPSGS